MLNELLATYDRAEATRRFALANGLDLDLARFYVAIALGESPGDVVTEAAPGSNAVVALPQPPEERP
jgi:hypothetical protein